MHASRSEARRTCRRNPARQSARRHLDDRVEPRVTRANKPVSRAPRGKSPRNGNTDLFPRATFPRRANPSTKTSRLRLPRRASSLPKFRPFLLPRRESDIRRRGHRAAVNSPRSPPIDRAVGNPPPCGSFLPRGSELLRFLRGRAGLHKQPLSPLLPSRLTRNHPHRLLSESPGEGAAAPCAFDGGGDRRRRRRGVGDADDGRLAGRGKPEAAAAPAPSVRRRPAPELRPAPSRQALRPGPDSAEVGEGGGDGAQGRCRWRRRQRELAARAAAVAVAGAGGGGGAGRGGREQRGPRGAAGAGLGGAFRAPAVGDDPRGRELRAQGRVRRRRRQRRRRGAQRGGRRRGARPARGGRVVGRARRLRRHRRRRLRAAQPPLLKIDSFLFRFCKGKKNRKIK